MVRFLQPKTDAIDAGATKVKLFVHLKVIAKMRLHAEDL